MFRSLSLACLVAAATSLAPVPTLSAQGRTYSAGTAKAMGQAVIDEEVKQYGRVTNAEWDREISAILGRLQRAAGYPDLTIDFVVVGDPEVNAAAVPGNAMIINAGLMTEFAKMTAGKGATPEVQHQLFTSYLAAVLAHELAHITLGHTDSLAGQLLALSNAAGAPDSMLTKPSFFAAAVKSDSEALAELAHTRAQESAADRTGSLYLLRAGWSIQDMMDLMRAFDDMERSDPSFYRTITYVRDHPRASAREAELEQFRGRLKALQADYDDALSLIWNNVSLPAAIQLLDSVLAYFPEMVPALHARGTAYHQMWLATVPVPTQQVRASLNTYGNRFLPIIRGEVGDQRLYARAKQDYAAALKLQPLARTAVQQALLEAYAGDCDLARKRARDAVLLDTLVYDVVNNAGVVLFVCEDYQGAMQTFMYVYAHAGESLTTLFNVGRSLVANKVPNGSIADASWHFKEYLKYDSVSQWAVEARKQLGITPTAVPAAAAPAPKGGSGAPALQGIELGFTADQVRAAMGPPSSTAAKARFTVMNYDTRGLALSIGPKGRVIAIMLNTPAAGSVDGVKVGDPAGVARERWGTPFGEGNGVQAYLRASWFQVVEISQGTIAMVAITTLE